MAFHLIVVNKTKGASARPEDKGVFPERREAIEAARRIIDDWMVKNYKPGMDTASLYSLYFQLGEVPSVFGDQGYSIGTAFDYVQYARDRAKQLCEPAA